ncbi:MAG: acyltransferase [Deltaproteobacteria bacterium]|jgi:peptidoglycan/LPS O-acetylase OafA/YrhL|nr:acyltransferase [Deltaproteobacteria bacterium]
MKTKRLSALDGMRGFAAIIVAFFWHYQLFFKQQPFSILGNWFYNFGWIMVDLFFVLSGFIFYIFFWKKIYTHTMSLKDFVIRRLSRLYPLHVLTLFIVFCFVTAKKYNSSIEIFEGFDYSLSCLGLSIFMLQNGWVTTKESFNAVAWSISIEFMMYLIFFCICWYSTNKKYLIYSIILIYFGLLVYFSGINTLLLNAQTARGLIFFFGGMITGEIYKHLNYLKKCNLVKKRKHIIRLCFLGIIGNAIPSAIWSYGVFKNWKLVILFLFFPLLPIIILDNKVISNLFSLKHFLYLGELSYSIYLIHYPVFLIIKNIDNYIHLQFDYSSIIFCFYYIIIVVALSHLSHFYFEKPLQKFIRRKNNIC